MISFFTFLTSLFLLASTVVAQGRTGVTRGQIFFGCYTARPTGSSTQPAPTQAANSASFSGCLVCGPSFLPFSTLLPISHSPLFLFPYAISTRDTDDRPTAVPSPPRLYSGTGKHLPKPAGVVPSSNSPVLNKHPTPHAQLLSGHSGECLLPLRHTGHHLVGHSPMLDLLLVPIHRLLDLLVVIDSAGVSSFSTIDAILMSRSNRFAYMWGDVRQNSRWRCSTDSRLKMEMSGDALVAILPVLLVHTPTSNVQDETNHQSQPNKHVPQETSLSLPILPKLKSRHWTGKRGETNWLVHLFHFVRGG
jgi:hypothetical protein